MDNRMGRAWVWSLLALACCGAPAMADDAALNAMYGSGAHAYFAGNLSSAYDDLSMAIKGGSKDPRAYYFRGVTLLRMGRESEAKADMQKGASLEAADVNQFYPVGKSLERVQGSNRLTLEKYRSL